MFGSIEKNITFVPMSAIDELNKRHIRAVRVLQKTANPKTYKYGMMPCVKEIGDRLNVSHQTVINYLSGMAKDGFLTEAITKEFKTLHIEP